MMDRRGLKSFEYALVLFVFANPKPDDIVAVDGAKHSIIVVYPC
jgi:hypothetical protein